MHQVKNFECFRLPSKTMDITPSKHKRSKSDPPKVVDDNLNRVLEASHQLKLDMRKVTSYIETERTDSPKGKVRNCLKQEILQLQKQLEDQFMVRCALKKALGYRFSSHNTTRENLMPKPAKDLIEEIAVLELEVVYLEQYVLTLYRKKFSERSNSTLIAHKGMFPEVSELGIAPKKEDSMFDHSANLQLPRESIGNSLKQCSGSWRTEEVLYSNIYRSHSSLSQQSTSSVTTFLPMQDIPEEARAYHSQHLSMLKSETSNTSLAEHLGTRIDDHVCETPNWLSEEMIKGISAIYCKIKEPALKSCGFPSSPISFSSSFSGFSSQGRFETWSPQCRKTSSFSSHLDKSFSIEPSKESSGPYRTMVEVRWVGRYSQNSERTEPLLQNFRSLVRQLVEVDPSELSHEEKLAFWINVHNALVMHAFLVYSVPRNTQKRTSLLLKAAYNIGGHIISVDMIQNSILGCRTLRPEQWFRSLFSSKMKLQVRDEPKTYAIEHREPLLHFALCSGSHSDPAVHLYTPKRVFRELEAAKEDYIQTNFSLNKEQKIVLPKIVGSYAKAMDMCPAQLRDMIEHLSPDAITKFLSTCRREKLLKSIEWIPHNFAFRFLLSRELV